MRCSQALSTGQGAVEVVRQRTAETVSVVECGCMGVGFRTFSNRTHSKPEPRSGSLLKVSRVNFFPATCQHVLVAAGVKRSAADAVVVATVPRGCTSSLTLVMSGPVDLD